MCDKYWPAWWVVNIVVLHAMHSENVCRVGTRGIPLLVCADCPVNGSKSAKLEPGLTDHTITGTRVPAVLKKYSYMYLSWVLYDSHTGFSVLLSNSQVDLSGMLCDSYTGFSVLLYYSHISTSVVCYTTVKQDSVFVILQSYCPQWYVIRQLHRVRCFVLHTVTQALVFCCAPVTQRCDMYVIMT